MAKARSDGEPKPHPLQPRDRLEQLLFSTIRLEATIDEGVASGTGFVLRVPAPGIFPADQCCDLLVTNKHNIKDAREIRFLVHEELPDKRVSSRRTEVRLPGQTLDKMWTMHPDPSVDLCALNFGSLREQAEAQGTNVYAMTIPESLIATPEEMTDLLPVETVLMIGYPDGLADDVHNLPLYRRGTTATPPGVDFDGHPTFYVDLPCFEGSSGSPVFLFDHGIYATRDGAVRTGGRFMLLGVLFQGPPLQGEEYVGNPLQLLHLGEVVKANQLFALRDVFLQQVRRLVRP